MQIPVKRLVAINDYLFFFCQNLRAANTNSEGNFAFSGDSLPCPFHKWVVSQMGQEQPNCQNLLFLGPFAFQSIISEYRI